ncbi:hypothetical protein [Algoriphagus sediminis]|uniref:VCBS repeat-containing protein n=1 Tax=Algoriphagus sediminis TaxID=3057113 RepID=A0ABT7YGT5_9BACT|nr:hypothetical protein [Algoriphagus sediminis]MDN3205732.1 hypothetical protein [Algoriphagus sediminis]
MPDPSILDKKTWEYNVLPDMRMRMGLYLPEDFGVTLPKDQDIPLGIYSEIPLIQRDDWQKLKDYFLENAPNSPLPQKEKFMPSMGIPGFEVAIPKFDFILPDLTTMIHVDKASQVWLGHRFRKLFRLDLGKREILIDSVTTSVAPVSINLDSDDFELLTMGLMDPSNDSLGSLVQYRCSNGQWETIMVADSLMRPTYFSKGDLNGDGVDDYVISQFGNHVGKLSDYLSSEEGMSEVLLKPLPGSRKTELLILMEI